MAEIHDAAAGATLGNLFAPGLGAAVGAAVGAAWGHRGELADGVIDLVSSDDERCSRAYGAGYWYDPATAQCVAPREVTRALVVAARNGNDAAQKQIAQVVADADANNPAAMALAHELEAAAHEQTRAEFVAQWVHGAAPGAGGAPMPIASVARLAAGTAAPCCPDCATRALTTTTPTTRS